MYTLPLPELLAVVSLSASLLYRPVAEAIHQSDGNFTNAITEWTGMGDSYAAGTGAGHIIEDSDSACFRYDDAYPFALNNNLQPRPPKFNSVACYGSKFAKIMKNQFLDAPSMLGRPKWGDKPEFVTLTMGGNDIGFKELLSSCVYSLNIFSSKSCDETIKDSMRRISSPDFVKGATDVIAAALRKGTAGFGPEFKVYVTGYAQFFNERTTQCNNVTFKPAWSPRPPEYLTIERRKALNKVARDLTSRLKTAVISATLSAPNRVFFVDIDELFEGHRFCDREEPNARDPDTWFLTYGSEPSAIGDFPDRIPRIRDLLSGRSNKPLTETEYFQTMMKAAKGDPEKMISGIEPLRTFHPKPVGHQKIAMKLKSVILDSRALSTGSAAPKPTSQ